jgi:UDP-N-acetylglucosamine diphosphorylase / glucose-1-phosphate thymidylyltransferase / UDP-N-acetylgalactosamine diphosphorylase / glucosamine-1-phosphate N-acetyltransferase / galactosamine-1-phosphate N-acetyltransferase
VIPAVVIAAGLGTRLRPLTERYPKPLLPIDGTPVLAHLLRELADAGVPRVTVVTGHLAEQVERFAGDGSGFGLDVDYARQSSPDGSAHAVVAAGATAPYLILGADIVYASGEIGRFLRAYAASGAAGALAVQARPGTVELHDGLVRRVLGDGVLGMPLWAAGPAVARCIEALPGARPFELATAFQHAVDAGEQIAGSEVGPARGLTTPFDLLEHNFPYLGSL